jgi:hypothetical protein
MNAHKRESMPKKNNADNADRNGYYSFLLLFSIRHHPRNLRFCFGFCVHLRLFAAKENYHSGSGLWFLASGLWRVGTGLANIPTGG